MYATGSFSIQRLAYYLICLSIGLAALYLGSAFFIPIVYGLFFSFMLKPVCDGVEKILPNRVVAILLSLLLVSVVLGAVFYLFFSQIMEVLDRADNIAANLQDSWSEITEFFGEMAGLNKREANEIVERNINEVVEAPFSLLSFGLATSGQIIANLGLTIVYCFFFLLYSTAFKRFLLAQFDREEQGHGVLIMRNIQAVATNYLSGMLSVMLILGVLNSLGLYLIGIKYALVWGFLGALLAVIPYVGTTIGGLLPFLYAIATTDTFWQPVAVIVLYTSVQFIEGNLITPKVVGNSVKINALAAVVSLIIGALFWGLAGVVIAIPLLAMARIVLDQIPPFKSVSLLLSDDLYADSGRFMGELNRPEYRLSQLFARRTELVSSEELNLTTTKPGDEVSQADAKVITDTKTE